MTISGRPRLRTRPAIASWAAARVRSRAYGALRDRSDDRRTEGAASTAAVVRRVDCRASYSAVTRTATCSRWTRAPAGSVALSDRVADYAPPTTYTIDNGNMDHAVRLDLDSVCVAGIHTMNEPRGGTDPREPMRWDDGIESGGSTARRRRPRGKPNSTTRKTREGAHVRKAQAEGRAPRQQEATRTSSPRQEGEGSGHRRHPPGSAAFTVGRRRVVMGRVCSITHASWTDAASPTTSRIDGALERGTSSFFPIFLRCRRRAAISSPGDPVLEQEQQLRSGVGRVGARR